MGQRWGGSRFTNGLLKGQQVLGTPTACSTGQLWVGCRHITELKGQPVLRTPTICSVGQKAGQASGSLTDWLLDPSQGW